MANIIVKYQEAVNSMVEKLKKNENVLAVMVFGSMITGDLWEESDIDLIVVMKNQSKFVENIYSTINDVQIQIKFVSLNAIYNTKKNIFIMDKLITSKIIFCRDKELEVYIQGRRYNPGVASSKTKENLIYLGKILKDINVSKKHLHNNGIYVAYSVAVRCSETLCKLFLNINGYTVSKDSIKLAISLNDKLKSSIDKLFFCSDNKHEEAIQNFIEVTEKYIKETIKDSTEFLIEIMKRENKGLTSQELMNLKEFNGIDINMEKILRYVYKQNLIYKSERVYKDENGAELLKENVYFV